MGMADHSTHLYQPLLLLRLQFRQLIGFRPLPDVSERRGGVRAKISRSAEYRRVGGAQKILDKVGVKMASEDFWQSGFDTIREMVDQLERTL